MLRNPSHLHPRLQRQRLRLRPRHNSPASFRRSGTFLERRTRRTPNLAVRSAYCGAAGVPAELRAEIFSGYGLNRTSSGKTSASSDSASSARAWRRDCGTRGYNTCVWNRSPRPAPNFLGSPIEVAQECEVIQLFVADSRAVMETIEALAPRAHAAASHRVQCDHRPRRHAGRGGTCDGRSARGFSMRRSRAARARRKSASSCTTSAARSRISCAQSRSSRRRARPSFTSAAVGQRRW